MSLIYWWAIISSPSHLQLLNKNFSAEILWFFTVLRAHVGEWTLFVRYFNKSARNTYLAYFKNSFHFQYISLVTSLGALQFVGTSRLSIKSSNEVKQIKGFGIVAFFIQVQCKSPASSLCLNNIAINSTLLETLRADPTNKIF